MVLEVEVAREVEPGKAQEEEVMAEAGVKARVKEADPDKVQEVEVMVEAGVKA